MPPVSEGSVRVALPPDVFKRLSRLNRELVLDRLTTGDRVSAPGAGESRPGERPGAESVPPESVTLETLIPGRELTLPHGRVYHIRRPAVEFRGGVAGAGEDEPLAGGADLINRYTRVFFGAGRVAAPDDLHESLRPVVLAGPERVTYLDIESCGLAGEMVFLVGLMRYAGGTLQVDQFLARDYSEERAMLAVVRDELAAGECLVTFNGKAFDVPSIQSRCIASGFFDPLPVRAHVDLLHESRRRWKKELPNCRLQTLEQMVCGRHRVGDIPGSEIPAAYHDFVRAHREGDARRRARTVRTLQVILHHNALDLVTMADLIVHILAGEG